jgi:diguanylate cyclase (GGDEF)-like protein
VFLASDPTLWALWSLALALCVAAAIGFVGGAQQGPSLPVALAAAVAIALALAGAEALVRIPAAARGGGGSADGWLRIVLPLVPALLLSWRALALPGPRLARLGRGLAALALAAGLIGALAWIGAAGPPPPRATPLASFQWAGIALLGGAWLALSLADAPGAPRRPRREAAAAAVLTLCFAILPAWTQATLASVSAPGGAPPPVAGAPLPPGAPLGAWPVGAFVELVFVAALGIACLAAVALAAVRRARRGEEALVALQRQRLRQEQLAEHARVESAEALQRVEAERDRLLRSAGAGVFDWDVATDRLLDAPPPGAGAVDDALLATHFDAWLRERDPSDREELGRQFEQLLAGRRHEVVCELRPAPAQRRGWRLLRAEVVARSPEGRPLRVQGSVVDIDARKRLESTLERERALFGQGQVSVLHFDAEPPHLLRYVSTLPDAAGGWLAALRVGAPLAEAFVDVDRPALEDCVARAAGRPGSAVHGQLRLRCAGAPWRLLQVLAGTPDAAGTMQAYLLDIDPDKQAEAQAAARSESLAKLVRIMSASQRFMESLQQLTELLQQSESREQGLAVLAQGGPALLPRWHGALAVEGEQGEERVACRWGDFFPVEPCALADCWAVRRKRLHHSERDSRQRLAPVCAHHGAQRRPEGTDAAARDAGAGLAGEAPRAALPAGLTHTLCVPLLDALPRPAVLHLATHAPLDEEALGRASWAAETLGHALSLSLTNLELRVSLREQAVRDGMTGLYNRRYFDDVLPHELARAQRTGDNLVLALLDIDHFKAFNDQYGHAAGDAVIKAVAAQVGGAVRASDLACRIGGEELALLLPGAQLRETCRRLDRLRQRVAATRLRHAGAPLPPVAVSIGVADVELGPPSTLLQRADVALYAAKRSGRNRIGCWEPSMSMDSDVMPLGADEEMAVPEGAERREPEAPPEPR